MKHLREHNFSLCRASEPRTNPRPEGRSRANHQSRNRRSAVHRLLSETANRFPGLTFRGPLQRSSGYPDRRHDDPVEFGSSSARPRAISPRTRSGTSLARPPTRLPRQPPFSHCSSRRGAWGRIPQIRHGTIGWRGHFKGYNNVSSVPWACWTS
jgi:hypothetical protein